MPEIKNTFMGSKMNKDADSRIVPPNEYRNATNISVSRSEGSDVGALENIKGNNLVVNFNGVNSYNYGYEVIGHCKDEANDFLYVFITNFVDATILFGSAPLGTQDLGTAFSSVPTAPGVDKSCQILKVNLTTDTAITLASGNFLNFSKTHRIEAVVIEDQLFWTDNRNQPRKISTTGSIAYQYEHQISLAKYYPYAPIKMINTANANNPVTSMVNKTNKLLTYSVTAICDNGGALLTTPSGGSMNLPLRFKDTGASTPRQFFNPDYLGSNKAKYITSKDITNLSKDNSIQVTSVTDAVTGSTNYKVLTISGNANDLQAVFDAVSTKPSSGAQGGIKVYLHYANPDYSSSWAGDSDFLKERFIRFSYRFKFEDNEYSLIAPFTQAAFIPEQFGHFLDYDDAKVKNSGHLRFFDNMVEEIALTVPLPSIISTLDNTYKIKEIDIVCKEDKSTNIEVVDSLTIEELKSNFTSSNSFFEYKYLSKNPFKVLDESENVRVYDKVPIKAKTISSVGNRVVFGNYVDRAPYPKAIAYKVASGAKLGYNMTSKTGESSREYPIHSVKQNRTYQVGFVLADKYGRQSEVILSSYDTTVSSEDGEEFGASSLYKPYISEQGTGTQLWFGDSLKILLDSQVQENLYNEVTNPLGWYSYKIVVKQQEQDYYNIFLSGINSLTPKTITTSATPEIRYIHQASENKSQIELSGDNINKIPRSLINVGPRDTKFAGSDVDLYPRVNPKSYKLNLQAFPGDETPFKADTVSTIAAFNDYNLETGSMWDFYNDGIPLTSTSSLPVATITSSNSFRMGPNGYEDETTNAAGELGYWGVPGGGYMNARFQTLGVYETKPIKSELEIFYETTTSGLLSDLNAAIIAVEIPGGFQDSNGNDTSQGANLEYLQTENDITGTDATLAFQLVDAGGLVITDTHSLVLTSVFDNQSTPADITSQFELYSVGGGAFKVKTKDENFVFSNTSQAEDVYTFTIKATVTGAATEERNLTFTGALKNTKPYFNNPNEIGVGNNSIWLWYNSNNGNPNNSGSGSNAYPISFNYSGGAGIYGKINNNNDYVLMRYQGVNTNSTYKGPGDGVGTSDINYFWNGARKSSLATGSIPGNNTAELYWKVQLHGENTPGDINSLYPVNAATGNITSSASSSSDLFRFYNNTPNSYITINTTTLTNLINNTSAPKDQKISLNTPYRIMITAINCDPNQTGAINNGAETRLISSWIKFT